MDPKKSETYIYAVVHPALLTIAISHFSDQTWMPWLLVIPYAFFAYITWPGLKPSTEEGLFWFFGRPFISAIAGYLMLKANGMPDHVSVIALSYATFSIYVFSNAIALLARMTPVLATAPELHYAARRNSVGLVILFGLTFMIVYQILIWLQMALG